MSEHVSARDAIARLSDEHLAADAAFAAEFDDAGRQRLLALAEGLRNLPEPGRFALLLRELEGREYEEIARIADLTPVEARQQVFRARLKLQGDVEAPTEHCDEVRAAISKAESSFHDRRSIEAHLESCQVCSWFAEALERRPSDLGLLFAPVHREAEAAAAAAAAAAGAEETPVEEVVGEPVGVADAEADDEEVSEDDAAPARRRRAVAIPVVLGLLLVGGGVALAVALSGGGGGGTKPVGVTSHAGPSSKKAPKEGGPAAHPRRPHHVGPAHHGRRHVRKVSPTSTSLPPVTLTPSQASYSSHGGSVQEQVDASEQQVDASRQQVTSRQRVTAQPRRDDDGGLPVTGLDLMLLISAALILLGLGLSIRQRTNPQ